MDLEAKAQRECPWLSRGRSRPRPWAQSQLECAKGALQGRGVLLRLSGKEPF